MAKLLKNHWLIILLLFGSIILNLHNAFTYNTTLGFDASGHIGYTQYLLNNHQLPIPHTGWEFNQPPLYYLLGAILLSVGIPVQLINLLAFYFIALLIWKTTRSKAAIIAFLALPMANIFPPLISNELLSGLFIILCLVFLLKIAEGKSQIKYIVLFSLSFILGFYTKTTSLVVLPLLPIALYLNNKKDLIGVLKRTLIVTVSCMVFISPFVLRNISLYGKPLVLNDDFFPFYSNKDPRDLNFFTNINWVVKLDTVNAHDYSFWGGLWNTYWIDGERVMTPVIELNKKALALWFLGFPLTIFSIYGLIKYKKSHPKEFIILSFFLLLSLASLILYNLRLPYNNVLKSFFAFGIVLPYAIGIGEAYQERKIKPFLIVLLLIQFALLLTYLYIQPWWHVVRIN